MYVVIGLGKTGVSCVRWLRAQGAAVRVLDTRDNPPGLDAVRAEFPGLELHCGGLRADWLESAQALVVSPGIAVATPAIAAAAAKGVEVIGDIELFARHVRATQPGAKVIGITGSNGKSTVTALVGEMATAAGRLADEIAEHRLGDLKIGDDAIFQRADSFNVFMRFFMHLHRFMTDSDCLFGPAIHGHD